MNYENLKVEVINTDLLVTINREQALNALNQKTMEELKHLFKKDAPDRDDIMGVVITGAGSKSFVAGADIKEFLSLDSYSAKSMAREGQEIFEMIENFPKPVIAAVNGFALGGGCELAMACHMRIAGENAKFGQPEVSLGIIAGYGGTQRLTRYVGKAKSMELHMTGDMIDAEEALRLGLVNSVVAAGEEVSRAMTLLRKIEKKAPLAISKVIECVNAYYDKSEDGFKLEVSSFGECAASDDFKEGASAFIEKRKPEFRGK